MAELEHQRLQLFIAWSCLLVSSCSTTTHTHTGLGTTLTIRENERASLIKVEVLKDGSISDCMFYVCFICVFYVFICVSCVFYMYGSGGI